MHVHEVAQSYEDCAARLIIDDPLPLLGYASVFANTRNEMDHRSKWIHFLEW